MREESRSKERCETLDMKDTDMTDAISIDALRASLNANVAARSQYERDKDSAEKITAQLIKHFTLDHKTLATKLSDSFFEAVARCNVERFDFINDSKRCNARFNIKALEKVRAIFDSVQINSVVKLNATANKYNVALLLTLDKQRDNASFSLTRQHAYAMFCKASRSENVNVREFALTLDVQESTALTQASSSFRALAACNVCDFDEDTKRVSNVNFDHAFFALVRERFAKK